MEQHCECGHARDEHLDEYDPRDTSCEVMDCDCFHFEWDGDEE